MSFMPSSSSSCAISTPEFVCNESPVYFVSCHASMPGETASDHLLMYLTYLYLALFTCAIAGDLSVLLDFPAIVPLNMSKIVFFNFRFGLQDFFSTQMSRFLVLQTYIWYLFGSFYDVHV